MKNIKKTLLAFTLIVSLLLSSASILVSAAAVPELAFKDLNTTFALADGIELDISKAYTVNVAIPDNQKYVVVLVPANKKTLYVSAEVLTQDGVYGTPKKIGSDQIKKAYLVPLTYTSNDGLVYGAGVTSWYNGNALLDTSVSIHFDRLKPADILSVKFTLYNGKEILGSRESAGANLVTLLKDCAQYWDSSADNYLAVTGSRILSCAFQTRNAAGDNGYWFSTPFAAAYPDLPTKLVVEVRAGVTVYTAETAYPRADATKVLNANVTSWYNGGTLLDTSVDLDFDAIAAADIKSIGFYLYNGDSLVGSRESSGANLVTLLKDCAPYWDASADSYLSVAGRRTLSCAFQTRTESFDNGYWVSSPCSLAAPQMPTSIRVVIDLGYATYFAEKTLA